MKPRNSLLMAGTIAAGIEATAKADSQTVDTLMLQLKSADESISGAAWQNAGPCGAKAVPGLGALIAEEDSEAARNAKRALMNVVRHAGRPGAERETKAVQKELVQLLKSKQAAVRKEAVWRLSEIGDAKAVTGMAALLNDKEAREDARCAILRMPREAALNAFRRAFKTAPDDFKYALADSLRALGEQIEGWPSPKLKPTRKTTIEAIKPA